MLLYACRTILFIENHSLSKLGLSVIFMYMRCITCISMLIHVYEGNIYWKRRVLAISGVKICIDTFLKAMVDSMYLDRCEVSSRLTYKIKGHDHVDLNPKRSICINSWFLLNALILG